jgi:hypothetical protein
MAIGLKKFEKFEEREQREIYCLRTLHRENFNFRMEMLVFLWARRLRRESMALRLMGSE